MGIYSLVEIKLKYARDYKDNSLFVVPWFLFGTYGWVDNSLNKAVLLLPNEYHTLQLFRLKEEVWYKALKEAQTEIKAVKLIENLQWWI